MCRLRTREDYDRFQQAFHAGDYDTAFAYMVESPRLSVFGLTITKPHQLGQLYHFLGEYLRETVAVERFALSADLLAVELLVRAEGLRELTSDDLRGRGLTRFHPIKAGEIQLMRIFAHYHLKDDKIEFGSFVTAPA